MSVPDCIASVGTSSWSYKPPELPETAADLLQMADSMQYSPGGLNHPTDALLVALLRALARCHERIDALEAVSNAPS